MRSPSSASGTRLSTQLILREITDELPWKLRGKLPDTTKIHRLLKNDQTCKWNVTELGNQEGRRQQDALLFVREIPGQQLVEY